MTKGELIAAMEDFKDDIEVLYRVPATHADDSPVEGYDEEINQVTEIHENGAQDASINYLLLF